MCRQVTCKKCGRPTWAGCGAHVDQVLRNVPPADRCHCKASGGSSSGTAGAKHGVSGSKRTTPKKVKVSTTPAPVEEAPKKRWWQR